MIELKNDALQVSFPEVHPRAKLNLFFMRTLRIPDDDRTYPLPPGLGTFPLRHVDDFAAKLPEKWLTFGGVMMPMYQAEALWLRFDSGDYPFAIKVSTGKINAVTGKKFKNELDFDEQDYMVTPLQPWLDGFCVKRGTIRQFVAMPLDQGYTVEEQVTGKAEFGGLQIIVYPMKASVFEARQRKEEAERALRSQQNNLWGSPGSAGGWGAPPPSPSSFTAPAAAGIARSPQPSQPQSMGMGAGGRMQQQIVDDPFNPDDWDTNNCSRCFIHLLNSATWESVTGSPPPCQPPTAADYNKYNLPWFDYYDENVKALKGSTILRKVKSVYEIAEEEELEDELPPNVSYVPKNVQNLSPKRSKDQVRDGDF
ncbi:MAG: hypothetical protein JSS83_16070 [Cyanobacteria bacterium SZAS LIN-3]|nr:hypothetical protein [Cyanobacteria bacterium SZAS LIN-3]